MQRDRSVTHEQINEFGDELLGVLVRTIYIVSPSDDEGQVEGTGVGLGDELCASLGGGVGVGGLEGGGEGRADGRKRMKGSKSTSISRTLRKSSVHTTIRIQPIYASSSPSFPPSLRTSST